MGLEHFSTALDLLKGFQINLYVGDEVIKGKLLGVEADHIILEDEKKFIYYYNIDKVQAITKNTREFKGDEIKENFPKTKSLTQLLETFRNSWVSILSLNKQWFSGVLSDIDADFATLINGDERILIKLTHVSNILKGFIPQEKKAESKGNEEKTEEKAEGKSEKKASEKSQTKVEKKTMPKPAKEENKPAAEEKPIQECLPCQTDESSPTLGWSESIKEVPAKPIMGEVKAALPIVKEAKIETAAPMISNEVKSTKPQQMEKKMEKTEKSEDASVTKAKALTSLKPVKEETKTVKAEKMTTTPMMIKEAKPVKKQEPQTEVKLETTQSHSSKTNAADHNTKTVWKPSGQDERLFRFAGEPAPMDQEKSFPFAGWPNRNHNNRSSRNLFF